MSSDSNRRLEAVLEREIAAAQSLVATLEAERAALIGQSPATVVEEAAEKTRLFGIIEQLETERRDLCEAAQVTLPPAAGVTRDAIPGVSASVADRWHALLELIAGCRVANEVNGYIINARRGQLNQLFQVLRGGPPVTYGPQGKTFAGSLRALARA